MNFLSVLHKGPPKCRTGMTDQFLHFFFRFKFGPRWFVRAIAKAEKIRAKGTQGDL